MEAGDLMKVIRSWLRNLALENNKRDFSEAEKR